MDRSEPSFGPAMVAAVELNDARFAAEEQDRVEKVEPAENPLK